ncbi:MAG: prepilin-type N-terminal cleavage/methylation domain-containing protein, partial [Spiribacter salinus]
MLMRRPTANKQKRALGLTLLEIVVTLAVLAVIAALVG